MDSPPPLDTPLQPGGAVETAKLTLHTGCFYGNLIISTKEEIEGVIWLIAGFEGPLQAT